MRTLSYGIYVTILSFLLLITLNIIPARANGGDFFEELALHGLEENPNMGSPFFGFARDVNGRGLNQVQVVAIAPDGTEKVALTNILGHYKLYGFSKEIDSESVRIICRKPGYVEESVQKTRYDDRPMTPIEANCTLSLGTS